MRATLLATMLLVGLTACGGGGDDDEAASPAGTTSGAATAVTTAAGTTTAEAPTETPARFLVRVNEQILKGQFGRAWESLHPAQQTFLRRSELAACHGTVQYPANATFRVTETYREPYEVFGTKLTRPSTAVTIQVVVSYEEEGERITSVIETFTQHAFRVGNRWTWIVSQPSAEQAKSDSC